MFPFTEGVFVSQDFSSEQFSVNLNEKPGCIVTAVVGVSPQYLGKIYKDAVRKVKKEVLIAGFRKGKAPDSVITSRYSDHVSHEHEKLLIDSAYNAVLLSNRKPLSPQSVRSSSIKRNSVDEGAQVEFVYEAFPVIANLEWERLSLPEESPKTSVSEEELAARLDNIAYFFATKTPVSRPSREGDFVSLSLHVCSRSQGSGETPIFENKYFKLSAEDMTDAFREKFLNVTSGHKVVETIATPEIQAFLNGDQLIFTVNAVIEVTIPELDDEKAKQLKAESLEDLKSKLRSQLELQAEDKRKQQRFADAEEALAALTEFELPPSLLVERKSTLEREKLLHARLIQYCSDDELEERKEGLMQAAEAEARKSLKLLFLSQKIFADEGLSISREELQHMMDICSRERFGVQPPQDLSREVLQELVMTARNRLTYHKAIERVLFKAKELASTPEA